MEGMMSDHTDAAIIMPAANPRNNVLNFGEISFLNTKTTAAPAAVPMNTSTNPSAVMPA